MKKYVILFVTAIAFCFSVASCGSGPEAIIKLQVKAANLTCPQDIGNGMTMQSVEYTGQYVVYYIKGSDDMVFSQENVTPEMKEQIIQTLRSQAERQEDVKKFLNSLKSANVGMIYHYHSGPESVMDVVIEAREL